jgi:SAM-dependent methyltransferase
LLDCDCGIDTVSFEQGDLTDLCFDDGSFDAVFAHGVLYHLSNLQAALAEVSAYFRPGGILGIQDTDEGGTLLAPRSPQLERAYLALVEALRRNGSDPYLGIDTKHCCARMVSSRSAPPLRTTTTPHRRRSGTSPSSTWSFDDSQPSRHHCLSPAGVRPEISKQCAR